MLPLLLSSFMTFFVVKRSELPRFDDLAYEDLISYEKKSQENLKKGISNYGKPSLFFKFRWIYTNLNGLIESSGESEKRENIYPIGISMEVISPKNNYGFRMSISYKGWNVLYNEKVYSISNTYFFLGFLYSPIMKKLFNIYTFIDLGFVSTGVYWLDNPVDSMVSFATGVGGGFNFYPMRYLALFFEVKMMLFNPNTSFLDDTEGTNLYIFIPVGIGVWF